jgi:O-antigen/teichoic acid export membrane protein
MVILCLGQAVNVLMGSVGLVLNMTHNEKYTLRALLISLFISVLLLLLLIPIYSAIGTTIAVSAALVIWNLLLTIEVYRLTGFKAYLH